MIHQRTHMSLSVSRAWSAHEPVGDPFGGPAYGEKEFFGLISAGLSIYAGISAGASIVGGLLIAGGVLSGIGVLTNNSTLKTLGSVASIAGGVGGFFAEGGWSGVLERGAGADSWSNKIGGLFGSSPSSGIANTPLPQAGAEQSIAKNIVGTPNSTVNELAKINDVSASVNITPPLSPSSVTQGSFSPVPNSFSNNTLYQAAVSPSAPTGVEPTGKDGGLMGWFDGLSSSEKLFLGQGVSGVAQGALGFISSSKNQPLVDAQTRNAEASTKNTEASTKLTDAKTAEQLARNENRNLDPALAKLVPTVKPGAKVTGGAYDYVALWRNATRPTGTAAPINATAIA